VIRTFEKVVAALSTEPGVETGRMFASEGLKIGGRIFAMEVKGKLVVKLSAERAEELRRSKVATAFDPGHGRPMKQWVSISPKANVDWLDLAREALAFGQSRPSVLRRPERRE
jgi:hypothetical protein